MIQKIYHFVMDKKIPTLASAIAFTLVMNGGSFLFLFVIISGFFSNSFQELIFNTLEDGKLKDLIVYFFNYQNNISYSILLVITSIYSASSLYYHLIGIVEFITDTNYKMSVSKRVLAIGVTILYLLGLNIITLLASEIILYLNYLYMILSLVLMLLIFILTVYVVQVVSLKTYSIKRLYKGILFTTIYFIIFTFGFGLYLKLFSNFKIVYGILSFFIILFFYIYMLSIGLLLGINFNHLNINIRILSKNKIEEVRE
ncbi:MAG: YihY/virulence factor BrkB family protein [Anaeroplasmataceae bacterium]|nr:YihY/virulence factor BrkB family protein [Anaeroplasmataceae bacterium]